MITHQDVQAKLLGLKIKFDLNDKYYYLTKYGEKWHLENPVNYVGYERGDLKGDDIESTPFKIVVTYEDENGYVIRNLFKAKNGKLDCVWKVIHVKEDAVYLMMKQFYSQTVMLWRDMCFKADSIEDIENHYTYKRGYQALKDYRKNYKICEVDY